MIDKNSEAFQALKDFYERHKDVILSVYETGSGTLPIPEVSGNPHDVDALVIVDHAKSKYALEEEYRAMRDERREKGLVDLDLWIYYKLEYDREGPKRNGPWIYFRHYRQDLEPIFGQKIESDCLLDHDEKAYAWSLRGWFAENDRDYLSKKDKPYTKRQYHVIIGTFILMNGGYYSFKPWQVEYIKESHDRTLTIERLEEFRKMFNAAMAKYGIPPLPPLPEKHIIK